MIEVAPKPLVDELIDFLLSMCDCPDRMNEADGSENVLPSKLEDRVYEILLDDEQSLSDEELSSAIDGLCEEHSEYTNQIRTLAARLNRGASAFGEVCRQLETPLPEKIDKYRILETLGTGGFGVVYRAEQQEPVKRIVALKLLLPSRSHGKSFARFEAERLLLARMQHSAIAQIFDAGATDDGQPYFAMEFVDGEPITDWCDRRSLDVRDRLELFVQVCNGVLHAHQKGVLHRDIKPTNVLVQEQDGKPCPKVIDFGVAKALDPDLGGRSMDTLAGGLVGTLEYMSPEQTAGRPVDIRADVYALGVLLYELLTGQLPFGRERMQEASLPELVRMVNEEIPNRASTALRESADPSEVASRRDTNVDGLLVQLRSDLDWVLLKTLQKDPDDRYRSVAELVSEIGCYLSHEPVEARQHAFWYVARKFAERHRVAVAIAGFVLLVCTAGVVALVWGLVQIDGARSEAIVQRDEARANAYAAKIATAQLSLQAGDIATAARHLRESDESLRGWEWRYLAARCDESVTSLKVKEMVRDVLWTGDGRYLIAGGYGGGVDLWDVAEGKVVRRLAKYETLREMALDPSGHRLVLATTKGVDVWDLESGKKTAELWSSRHNTIIALAVAPDDGTVVFVDEGRSAFAAPISGEGDLRDLTNLLQGTTSLAYSPDGVYLAAGTDRGEIRVIDLDTESLIWKSKDRGSVIDALIFDGAGKRLIAGERNGTIKVFDFAQQRIERRLRSTSSGRILRLAVGPRDKLLYAAGGFMDSVLDVFDLDKGEFLGSLRGHQRGVEGLAISPDGSPATSSRDHRIKVWPRFPSPSIARAHTQGKATTTSISPNGDRFVIASAWRGFSLGSFGESGKNPVIQPARHLFSVFVTMQHGRDRIYAITGGHSLVTLDPSDGHTLRSVPFDKQVTNLTPGPRGQQVLLSTADSKLLAFDARTLESQYTVDLPHMGVGIAYQPGGDLVAVGDLSGVLHMIDAETGRLVRGTKISTRGITSLAWSSDGALIAAAHGDGSIDLIEPETGRVTATLRGHEGYISSLCFSPGGERLVSAGLDRKIRFWHVELEIQLLVVRFAGAGVGRLSFDPSGTRLLGAMGSHGVSFWLAPRDVELGDSSNR